MFKMLEIRATTRVGPVGSCIYCGGSHGRLSEEHVVPLGLGGNAILPEASCQRCSDITSAFEGKVLRGFMLEARTAGKFPTRHPKKRLATLPLAVKRGDEMEAITLPSAESPGFLHLPRLDRAAFLAGRPPVSGVNVCGTETLVFGKSPDEVVADLGAKAIQSAATLDVASFVRMLAKIGYSFAVAAQGSYPLTEVPVLPLILGSVFDGGTWVGSVEYDLAVEAQSPQHALGLISLVATVEKTPKKSGWRE